MKAVSKYPLLFFQIHVYIDDHWNGLPVRHQQCLCSLRHLATSGQVSCHSVISSHGLAATASSPCCCRFNETFHFLFWTMFGVANQDYVDMPQFVLAEFVGRILYGIFTLVIVIVLLNMLIAMITNSFQKIEVRGGTLCSPPKGPGGFLTTLCGLRMMQTWSGNSPDRSCTSVTSGRVSPCLCPSTSSPHPKLSITS